jgi:hypothetical protein
VSGAGARFVGTPNDPPVVPTQKRARVVDSAARSESRVDENDGEAASARRERIFHPQKLIRTAAGQLAEGTRSCAMYLVSSTGELLLLLALTMATSTIKSVLLYAPILRHSNSPSFSAAHS